MSRKYNKPPVVEALCELGFDGSEWDETVSGRFYDRVKEKFPKRRQVELQKAQFTFSNKGHSAAGIQRLPGQMQFLNESGSSLLQLRQDLLVVNQLVNELQPYPHFEGWESNIHWALKIYMEMTKPKGIHSIGLRYINRIVIPQPQIRMEKYFNIHPQLPRQMGDVHGSFMIRVELPCLQKGHTVLATFATAPVDKPGQTAHLLDLYAIFQVEKQLNEQEVRAEIQTAHANVETAFEGSITEDLRQLFEPID